MNTDIKLTLTATAANINVYKAEFAGCDIELAEDRQSLQVIDARGDHETWERDEDGNWIFVGGSNGQAPTLHWPADHYSFLEQAIAGLEISAAAAALGRKGGSTKSEAKTQAARSNGAKGGRPKKGPYDSTFHKDGSVTVWDCGNQEWIRTSNPSDSLLATLGADEREKVMDHTT